jgi:hypothetical protein
MVISAPTAHLHSQIPHKGVGVGPFDHRLHTVRSAQGQVLERARDERGAMPKTLQAAPEGSRIRRQDRAAEEQGNGTDEGDRHGQGHDQQPSDEEKPSKSENEDFPHRSARISGFVTQVTK